MEDDYPFKPVPLRKFNNLMQKVSTAQGSQNVHLRGLKTPVPQPAARRMFGSEHSREPSEAGDAQRMYEERIFNAFGRGLGGRVWEIPSLPSGAPTPSVHSLQSSATTSENREISELLGNTMSEAHMAQTKRSAAMDALSRARSKKLLQKRLEHKCVFMRVEHSYEGATILLEAASVTRKRLMLWRAAIDSLTAHKNLYKDLSEGDVLSLWYGAYEVGQPNPRDMIVIYLQKLVGLSKSSEIGFAHWHLELEELYNQLESLQVTFPNMLKLGLMLMIWGRTRDTIVSGNELPRPKSGRMTLALPSLRREPQTLVTQSRAVKSKRNMRRT